MAVRLFHSIADTCGLLSVGRSTIYRLIDEGRLESRKIGARTVITGPSLERFAAELITARIATEPPSFSARP